MVGEAVLCARGGASTIQFIPWWANSDLGRGWVPELLAMAGRKTMSAAARLASTGSARELTALTKPCNIQARKLPRRAQ